MKCCPARTRVLDGYCGTSLLPHSKLESEGSSFVAALSAGAEGRSAHGHTTPALLEDHRAAMRYWFGICAASGRVVDVVFATDELVLLLLARMLRVRNLIVQS